MPLTVEMFPISPLNREYGTRGQLRILTINMDVMADGSSSLWAFGVSQNVANHPVFVLL